MKKLLFQAVVIIAILINTFAVTAPKPVYAELVCEAGYGKMNPSNIAGEIAKLTSPIPIPDLGLVNTLKNMLVDRITADASSMTTFCLKVQLAVIGGCPAGTTEIGTTPIPIVGCFGVKAATDTTPRVVRDFKQYNCITQECDTAFGIIDATSPTKLIQALLQYSLMFAGAILIITLIVIGYRVLTSAGNPEKIQATKELTTSLFAGLVLIIFSFVILRIIGVDILGLPKFQ